MRSGVTFTYDVVASHLLRRTKAREPSQWSWLLISLFIAHDDRHSAAASLITRACRRLALVRRAALPRG